MGKILLKIEKYDDKIAVYLCLQFAVCAVEYKITVLRFLLTAFAFIRKVWQ